MKTTFALGLVLLSFSALADYKHYICTTDGEIGGTSITEASLTIKGNASSIKGANLVAIAGKKYLLNSDFRGPEILRGVPGTLDLEGKNNSRINPLGDVEYLIFNHVSPKLGLEEMPSTFDVKYISRKGPVGNRGGEFFELNCTITNR